MTRFPLRAALAALALTPSLLGQIPPSEGPLVGSPLTVLVDPGTEDSSGPMATDAFHRKRAGFGTWHAEASPPGPFDPVFSTTEMFGDGVAAPAFRINAYSIGLDEVLATTPVGGKSFVDVPVNAWGAVSFSVSKGTTGVPGSRLAGETLKPDGVGADIFTWMLPGSTLPPAVAACFSPADAQRGSDSEEIDLYPGTSQGEIVAFDIYTPMYEVGPPIRAMLPDAPKVFFSVHHDDVFPTVGTSPVPSSWFGASSPSSASILVTQWDPVLLSWSTPSVFIEYTLLDLDVDDDVDALAVDLARCKALFSIAHRGGSSVAKQLQIAAWTCPPSGGYSSARGGSYSGGGVSTGEYRADNGDGTSTSAAERAGVASGGEIDGVCTIDPGDQGGLGGVAYGSPSLRISPNKVLGAQIYRDENVTGPTVTAVVTGVPTTATFPLQALELWLGIPPAGPGAYTLWPFPVYVDSLDGSDPTGNRTVPLTSPSLSSIVGLEVDILWVIRPAMPKPSAPGMRIEL
jgi:hypothetical protein